MKIEIIKPKDKLEDIILLIQEPFSLRKNDVSKRKANNDAIIERIRSNLKTLQKHKKHLSLYNKWQIGSLAEIIEDIVGTESDLGDSYSI